METSAVAGKRQALVVAVGQAVQAYQRSSERFDDAVAARLGLNRTDLRCLGCLADGPRTAGQLAEATGLSSAATTTLVDRLQTRGLVRRVPDPSDRRKVLAAVTEQGQEITGRFYGPLAADGAALLERYGRSELERLHEFLVAARV